MLFFIHILNLRRSGPRPLLKRFNQIWPSLLSSLIRSFSLISGWVIPFVTVFYIFSNYDTLWAWQYPYFAHPQYQSPHITKFCRDISIFIHSFISIRHSRTNGQTELNSSRHPNHFVAQNSISIWISFCCYNQVLGKFMLQFAIV